MKNNATKDFIAYEYLSLTVDSEKEPLYIDCYENFGWLLINNSALVEKEDYFINNVPTNYHKKINIKFKRDRKIKNKAQLLSLQRKLESSLKEIERLEKEPYSKAFILALTIGIIGTIFLTVSVFSITAATPLYVPCVISGVIGIVLWIMPYFIYKNKYRAKEQENISLIDEQYNNIYNICEQAKNLTNQ